MDDDKIQMGKDPSSEAEDIGSEDESFEPNEPIENLQLIKLVRTSAGAEMIANGFAQDLFKSGQNDWGGMLGAAPTALGRLGQCFVLASDPLAASLVFPESSGLPYKSLKTNLVHLSDLGRRSFLEAESKMKKLSMVAQAVCEPSGTIDRIIEAVEDNDLAEIELPDLLDVLKSASSDCIADTKAIKEKVDAWSIFGSDLYKACQDQDQTLGRNETDLKGQIMDKKLILNLKNDRVQDVKSQTARYRQIVSNRQGEFNDARKRQNRGVMTDLGANAGEAIIDTLKAIVNPFSGIDLTFNWVKTNENQQHYSPDSQDPMSVQDAGYVFAGRLLDPIDLLANLLTNGPDETLGVDWESLAGRIDQKYSIRSIQSHLQELRHQFSREQSKVSKEVRKALRPVENVAATILDLLRDDSTMNVNVKKQVLASAKEWRHNIKEAHNAIGEICSEGVEKIKQRDLQRKETKEQRNGTTKMSRAEIRYKRFRRAQKELFDAETMLNQRLEEEIKATEDFNAMQLHLERLLTSQTTMAEVKEIVGQCVRHLQLFCDRIDQLTTFFSDLHNIVGYIDKHHVDLFNKTARTGKALGERAKDQSTEADREKKERLKRKKLEQLRIEALRLKGCYLFAQAMSNTYVEVSKKHIMPGVSTIDSLSVPAAAQLSRQERVQKIAEVGDRATRARKEVKQLANARKEQFRAAMRDNRGEIEEMK